MDVHLDVVWIIYMHNSRFFSSEINLGARIFRSPIEFHLQDCLRILSILLLLFYIYLSLNKTPIYKTLKLKSYSYHAYYIFLWLKKKKLEIFGEKGHFSNIAKIQSELNTAAPDVPFTYVFLGLGSGICIYVCILLTIWLAYNSTKFVVQLRANYISKHLLKKLNEQCKTYKRNSTAVFSHEWWDSSRYLSLPPLKNVIESNQEILNFLWISAVQCETWLTWLILILNKCLPAKI